MKKYQCSICGYVYDPEKGDPDDNVEPGTAYDALSETWTCPECGADKDLFEEMEE